MTVPTDMVSYVDHTAESNIVTNQLAQASQKIPKASRTPENTIGSQTPSALRNQYKHLSKSLTSDTDVMLLSNLVEASQNVSNTSISSRSSQTTTTHSSIDEVSVNFPPSVVWSNSASETFAMTTNFGTVSEANSVSTKHGSVVVKSIRGTDVQEIELDFGVVNANSNQTNMKAIHEETMMKENELSKEIVDNSIEKTEASDVLWLEKTVLIDALDSDWINNDPSQSNIPIRKRRRNRKGVANVANVNNSSDEKVGRNNLEAQSLDNQGMKTTLNNADLSKCHLPTSAATIKGALNKPGSMDISESPQKNTGKSNKDTGVTVTQVTQTKSPPVVKGKRIRSSGGIRKNVQEIKKPFTLEAIELPDPLVTGKLDEEELNKLELAANDILTDTEKNLVKDAEKVTTGTRFRKRPSNMSVLEVASQKKAKSNDTSGVYTKPVATRAKRGRAQSAKKATVTYVAAELNEKQSNLKPGSTGSLQAATSDANMYMHVADQGQNMKVISTSTAIECRPQTGTAEKTAQSVPGGSTERDNCKASANDNVVVITPPKKARFR